MADGVGPDVDDVESGALDPPVDRRGADAGGEELPPADLPVLSPREVCNHPIGRGWPAFTTHMTVKTGHPWSVADVVCRVGAVGVRRWHRISDDGVTDERL